LLSSCWLVQATKLGVVGVSRLLAPLGCMPAALWARDTIGDMLAISCYNLAMAAAPRAPGPVATELDSAPGPSTYMAPPPAGAPPSGSLTCS
jgi:hypothetical protein